jgi:glycosyltransferase involved in cell wall biosynthesis
MLLEAISRLTREFTLRNGFLTIVGDGELRRELEQFIDANGLKWVVQVVGYKADVSDFLLKCTHLVSVSTNEGLPISFFEAKLSGMRIISTPSGGGNEIFDGFDYELSSFDVDDLVKHLKAILHEEISGESRKKIALKSAWMQVDKCSRKYYNLLDNLAEQ